MIVLVTKAKPCCCFFPKQVSFPPMSRSSCGHQLSAAISMFHCTCSSFDLPNKTDWGVYTPLLIAIQVGSLKCVQLLLEAGADVQGVVGKETPLMVAAANGLTEIMMCLVLSGADPNVHDHFGRTPIEIAALYNRRKAVEILFPVTSRIPSVRDWSVEGIISYAKSMPVKDKGMYKKRLASWKNQGHEEFKNKEYLAAINIYTQALDLDPDDATLFSNRSLCWLHLGDGKKALMDAQACRMMRPAWPKACYREGAAFVLLKDYAKACGAFLDGLKLEPGNIEIEKALREAMESLKISRH